MDGLASYLKVLSQTPMDEWTFEKMERLVSIYASAKPDIEIHKQVSDEVQLMKKRQLATSEYVRNLTRSASARRVSTLKSPRAFLSQVSQASDETRFKVLQVKARPFSRNSSARSLRQPSARLHVPCAAVPK